MNNPAAVAAANDNPKDKKKSFIERIFNFAGHTMKLNKKSTNRNGNHKKKLKKPLDRTSTTPLLNVEIDDIETCTFCDYCDLGIITTFTGQNIICHESCKEKSLATIKAVEYANELNCSTDSLKFVASSTFQKGISDFVFIDESTVDNGSVGSCYFTSRDSISTVRSNFRTNTDYDSYTFSTADLSTIKQYGISIKKLASFRGKANPLAADGNPVVREIQISKLNDNSYDTPNLPDDLTELMKLFNNNEKGLFIENTSGLIMGKVRVFINLLRPIKMLLTARPPSMFDLFPDCDKGKATIDRAYYNKEAIFWLPRGTTNLLYININCPTSELISMLLTKFNIQNNPKKFALYEHTVVSASEVEVRKLKAAQCPLKIMMSWCREGPRVYEENLMKRRFVLQENDCGLIEWNEFSIPELTSFLRILMQEEAEKKRQIYLKFAIIKAEIERCMKKSEQKQ